MTIQELHNIFLLYPNVCTDTRNITKDCIFFALTGNNFNGNTFTQKAIDEGAAYVVTDEKEYHISNQTILVSNVLETLQELATYHRNYHNPKIIALTGSNGKTTTKELINAVLSKKYKTVATLGNLNNHIGVPLTLLKITKETEIAIIEMGANHLKEIDFLCNIALPDFGYVTNFGKAHLEGFGGIEGVIKGKSELYNYLISNKKTIFLNADDSIQLEKLNNHINKIGFSKNNHTYYLIELTSTEPYITIHFENTTINSQLIGEYNFTNCCAAILMGKNFNVPIKDIKEAIENYQPKNNRSELIQKNGHQIILDAYNANPTSMEAALKSFFKIKNTNKVLFLGDMLELGKHTTKEHQNIVDLISKMGFDKVFLIGEHFFNTKTNYNKLKNFKELESILKDYSIPQSNILIKGSRGIALERVLELI